MFPLCIPSSSVSELRLTTSEGPVLINCGEDVDMLKPSQLLKLNMEVPPCTGASSPCFGLPKLPQNQGASSGLRKIYPFCNLLKHGFFTKIKGTRHL